VYTECPNCHTLFRIGVEQLKAASGKAHCCRCDQVFNALDNLRTRTEKSDAWPESRLIDNLQEQQNLPFDGLLQSPKDPEVSISSLIDTFEVEDSLPIIDPLANSETTQNSDPFEPDLDLSDLDMDSLQLNIEDSLSRSEFSPDSKPAPAEETQLHTVESSLDAFDPSIEISGFGIDSNLFEFDSDARLSLIATHCCLRQNLIQSRNSNYPLKQKRHPTLSRDLRRITNQSLGTNQNLSMNHSLDTNQNPSTNQSLSLN